MQSFLAQDLELENPRHDNHFVEFGISVYATADVLPMSFEGRLPKVVVTPKTP